MEAIENLRTFADRREMRREAGQGERALIAALLAHRRAARDPAHVAADVDNAEAESLDQSLVARDEQLAQEIAELAYEGAKLALKISAMENLYLHNSPNQEEEEEEERDKNPATSAGTTQDDANFIHKHSDTQGSSIHTLESASAPSLPSITQVHRKSLEDHISFGVNPAFEHDTGIKHFESRVVAGPPEPTTLLSEQHLHLLKRASKEDLVVSHKGLHSSLDGSMSPSLNLAFRHRNTKALEDHFSGHSMTMD